MTETWDDEQPISTREALSSGSAYRNIPMKTNVDEIIARLRTTSIPAIAVTAGAAITAIGLFASIVNGEGALMILSNLVGMVGLTFGAAYAWDKDVQRRSTVEITEDGEAYPSV